MAKIDGPCYSIVMKSGIYSITCLVNGKRYIGSAVNFNARWSTHKCALIKGRHHSIHLQRAWDKHGGDNFRFSVLEYCEPELLIETEQRYLDEHRPYGGAGYNIAPTAGSTLGAKRTREQIEKTASKNRGRKLSAEHRRKIGEASRGRIHSQETKAKMSAAASRIRTQSYRPLTDKQKAVLHKSGAEHPWFGRKHSEETRRRLSECKTQYSVEQVNTDGEVIKVWENAKMASAAIGLKHPDSIYRAVNNSHRKAGGYYWRRLTDRAVVS